MEVVKQVAVASSFPSTSSLNNPTQALSSANLKSSFPSTDFISVKFSTYEFCKRAIDIIVSILLLLCLSPLFLFLAALVRCSSPGPIVFVQNRLTRGGKVFRMYKFRTMVANAENPTGAVWAQAADPRVTGLGRILRLTRLDELPQLVNIIRGDMTLVGPRPERPEIAQRLIQELPEFERRHEVKGGLTGLAQISSGYASCKESYKKKLELDIIYIDNRSLLLDLQIAIKTFSVIVTGFGAR